MYFLSKMSKIAIIFKQNLSCLALKKEKQALHWEKWYNAIFDNSVIPCSNCKINLELDPFDTSAGLFDYIARTVCCV